MLFLFLAVVRIVEATVSIGLPLYTLRAVSTARAKGAASQAVAVVVVAVMGLAISATVWSVVAFSVLRVSSTLAHLEGSDMLVHVVLGGLMTGCVRIFSEALKAEQRPGVALLGEFSLPPFVATAVCVATLIIGQPVRGLTIVWAYQAGLAVAIVMLCVSWLRISRSAAVRLDRKLLQETGLQMRAGGLAVFWAFALAALAYASLPAILVSLFGTVATVGQFGMAQRLVGISAIIMAGLSSTAMPAFAHSHALGDTVGLQRMLRHSRFTALSLGGPPLLLMAVAASPVLSLVGSEFTGGAWFLVILAAGQIFNLSCGLAAEFLQMTGRQETELRNTALGAGLLVTLGSIGGHFWGATGIAAAYAISLITAKTLSLRAARLVARSVPLSTYAASGT